MKTIVKKVRGANVILRLTDHYLDRQAQRFEEADLPLLDRAIEKAIEKNPVDYEKYDQPKIKWTHPTFGFTIVFQRIGMNAIDLITCFKKGQPDD
jgi:hypothetical protein